MRTTRIRTALIAAIMTAVAAFAVAAPAGAAVPGTNDFGCKPSAAHPRPLLMLEGFGGNSDAWRFFAPKLKADGYCLFTTNYGEHPLLKALIPYPIEGVVPMQQSAKEIAPFVDRILAGTGAAKIDILGHSEGTMMPRWYLEKLGGAAKVQKFVAMTPLWRGTAFFGAAQLRDLLTPLGLAGPVIGLVHGLCGTCTQALTGSDYLNELNADGEAIPGIEHTNIVTRYDELVQPYTSGIMRDGGTNVVLQDVCPNDVSEHVAVAFDPNVLQLVERALDPEHAKPVRCAY